MRFLQTLGVESVVSLRKNSKVDQLLQKSVNATSKSHLLVFLPQVFFKIVRDFHLLTTILPFIPIFNFPSLEEAALGLF